MFHLGGAFWWRQRIWYLVWNIFKKYNHYILCLCILPTKHRFQQRPKNPMICACLDILSGVLFIWWKLIWLSSFMENRGVTLDRWVNVIQLKRLLALPLVANLKWCPFPTRLALFFFAPVYKMQLFPPWLDSEWVSLWTTEQKDSVVGIKNKNLIY